MREYRERYCYGCGKSDHFIKSCPFKTSRSGVSTKAALLEIEGETEDQKVDIQDMTSTSGEVNSANKTAATCVVSPMTDDCLSTAYATLEVATQVKYVNSVPIANISQQEKRFNRE